MTAFFRLMWKMSLHVSLAKRTTLGLILTRRGRLSSQIIEPDSSSDEVEQKPPESGELVEQGRSATQFATESADFTSQDPVEKAAQQADKKVDTFIHKSCGCQLGLKHRDSLL